MSYTLPTTYKTGYTTPTFNISQTSNTIDIKGNVSVSENSRLRISNTDIDVKWDYLINSIKEINRRLKIVIPDKEMFAKYPTLKDAYDQYQLTSEIEPKFLSNEFLQAYENYIILEAMLKDNK